MHRFPRLPPCPTRPSSGPGQLPVCSAAVRMLAVGVILVVCTGCGGTSRLARHERSGDHPAVTELTPPAVPKSSTGRTAAIAAADQKSTSLAADQQPAGKTRRRIPDWLRLGQDKQSVPLPATPGAESAASEVPTGPVESF